MSKLQKTQLVLWAVAIVLAAIGLIFSESLMIEASSAASSYVLHLMSVALVILSGYVVMNYRKNEVLCCMVTNLALFYTELMYLMLKSDNQTELYSLLIVMLLSVAAFPAYSRKEKEATSETAVPTPVVTESETKEENTDVPV